MKKYILLLFSILLITGCKQSTEIAQNVLRQTPYAQAMENEERKEAKRIILSLIDKLNSENLAFSAIPADINSPEWIKLKLENIARREDLIRNTLAETVVKKPWSKGVKRAFIVYFMNFDSKANSPSEFGFMQSENYKMENEFKYLLTESGALKPYRWPVLSKFGKKADLNAWMIVIHSNFVDTVWQDEVLFPRLKNLCKDGESCPIGCSWFEKRSPEYLSSMISELGKEGPPWSELIPKIKLLQRFFDVLPEIAASPKTPPIEIE